MLLIKKYNYIFLILALLVLGLEIYQSQIKANKPNFSRQTVTVQRQLSIGLAAIEEVWKDSTLITRLRLNELTENDLKFFDDKGIIALCFEEGNLTTWSSNEIDKEVASYIDSTRRGIAELKVGMFYYEYTSYINHKFMLCIPIYKRYAQSNPQLKEGFPERFGLSSKALLSKKYVENYDQITLNEEATFYLKFIRSKSSFQNKFSFYLFVLFVLSLSIFLYNLYFVIKKKYGFTLAWLLLVLLILSFRILSFELHIPDFLYTSVLFNPEVYNSFTLLPSFGDLLLDGVLLFIVSITAFNAFFKLEKRIVIVFVEKWGSPIFRFVSLLFVFGYTILVISAVRSLVNDSNVVFNNTNLLESGAYLVIGLLIIAIILTSYFLVIRILTVMMHYCKVLNYKILVYLFGVFVLSGFLLIYASNLDSRIFLDSAFFFLTIFLCQAYLRDKNYFSNVVSVFIIITVYTSLLFYETMKLREDELVKTISEKVYSPKDTYAEGIFLEIENKIEHDQYIKKYFTSPLLLKSQLEKYVKQLYFSGYLSKFDIILFDYDAGGNDFKENNYYSLDFINEIYSSETKETLSNSFYLVSNPALRFGYMAKFDICTPQENLGHLFIVLRPKFIQEEKIFTELLTRSNEDRIQELGAFSYAVYQDGQLMYQSGNYSYNMVYDFPETNSDGYITSVDRYKHYVKTKSDAVVVVVSKQVRNWLVPLSVFSLVFMAYSILIVVVIVMNILFYLIQFAVSKLRGDYGKQFVRGDLLRGIFPLFGSQSVYFSTRIQSAMIGLVLSAMLLTGYFTIQYINYKSLSRQRELLNNKVNTVLNSIQSESLLDEMLDYPEQLSGYLNQLAYYFNTDINLYDLSGSLLASTQLRVFEAGLFLDKINPYAFNKLSIQNKSQHSQNEKIGNLNYMASYVPVFDSEHNLVAYLNVPFFSNEKELKEELSAFVLNFINIYVFFFIVTGILAFVISQRITAPLSLIRQRLAQTQFSKKNERLEWKQNDEIGQLVSQYNLMLSELEESATLLAKSEREDAWKEMAKQIAHEIKNPLTPMKLSVQHLQRAWNQKSDKLEDTFKKVTTVLVEQIDSLSILASEFATFAKMPQPTIARLCLNDNLKQVVTLYQSTDQIVFNFDAPENEIYIIADGNQLSRVFNNIIKNAVQSIPEGKGGIINIKLYQKDSMAKIEISDNGVGMDERTSERIFTPSFSTKNSGMGLGLAISNQIVEQTGGSISFVSELNKGSIFYITLPICLD
jgi:signal transduction histidine kinase